MAAGGANRSSMRSVHCFHEINFTSPHAAFVFLFSHLNGIVMLHNICL